MIKVLREVYTYIPLLMRKSNVKYNYFCRPGSLYVSGAPGTGKTATLTHLLNNKKAKYKSIFLNCMVLKSSIAIFKEVAKQLNPKSGAKTEKEALKEIEKYTTGKGDVVLLGELFSFTGAFMACNI